MSDDIDLDDFDAPDRPDFRRIGRGIPYVMGLDGKRARYSRASNSGKILDDESNLTDWKLRTELMGAAQRPELLAIASTLDPQRDKKQLRDLAEQCLVAGKGSERAIKGTAVHAMFDHIDRGDDWEPAPQYVQVCNAYLECLDRYGLVPIDIEVHCINDMFRLAGTLDRRFRTMRSLLAPDGRIIPIGSCVVGDTKTGQTLEYASGSYATQLTAYVDSLRYDVETDERSHFDPPNFPDWAVIIHADAELGTCDAYWIDCNAGREGLRLARMVKAWRNRTDLITPATPPLATLPVSHPDVPDVEEAIPPMIEASDYGDAAYMAGATVPGLAPVRPSEAPGDPRVHEWLRGRVKAIVGHSERAGKALQLAWPLDVPGLKHQGHTAGQLDAIEKAVDRIETDYSIPFGAPKPGMIEESKKAHPSWSDRWAHPDGSPTPPDQVEVQRQALNNHPRRALIAHWVELAQDGGVDESIDTYALSNALYEFANLNMLDWPDEELTIMLDGSLRALGYDQGVRDLGRFDPEHAPILMSAAFAITAGNAMLLYDDKDRPVVRTIAKP